MQNYVYDAKFSGNILIVKRTECGKTYFTQRLAINKFFGQLKRVESVLTIELQTEEKLKSSLVFHAM